MENPIDFLEKPVTADEVKIASLLKQIIKAITAKDVKLLFSMYSDTASIEMSTSRGVFLNKKEYQSRMSEIIGSVRNICFRDVIMRISGQEATISCVITALLMGRAFPAKNQVYFKCVKTEGRWLIKETRYI